jgi:DNA repair photolyase
MPLRTVNREHASPRKGRGAGINPEGRFEKLAREAFDDGWALAPSPGEGVGESEGAQDPDDLPPLKTQVTIERVRSTISHNDSPDIPFSQSINPYRGCEHGCVYCLSGDTPILMGDGTARPLAELHVGDSIYGTVRTGWYRRYTRTRVVSHWSVVKPAYRITLEDGTQFVASGDHRFLTQRGWKFVADLVGGQRPHLTTNNKLMGTGGFAAPAAKDRDYRLGYLCGLIRGDGLVASYHYQRMGRSHGDQHQFRLALCDMEALQRAQEYLHDWGIATHEFVFQKASGERQVLNAIRTHAKPAVEQVRPLVAWPASPSLHWSAGFLAGIFDAEGSYSQGVLRISNTDAEIVARIARCLRTFNFHFCIERVSRERIKPIDIVRITGGLREHLRFFHTVEPAIARKCDIAGQAVKSEAQLRVAGIEALGKALRLYDITTETGDFIANGVVSHNCYARPSYAYLNLSPGLDFETRLFAKINAAEVLRAELARPGYACDMIALGANTDPYQPIEREYRITRGILEVLAECEHPVGIVTKSALIERDLDVLVPMAGKRLVHVFVSLGNLDHELARQLEPRCAAPQRRLETIRRLSAAGVPVGVIVAPVIPFLTDDRIESVLEAAAAAGASEAAYELLRLPYEVKGLFRDWLQTHYPLKAKHVMSRVNAMRGGRDNDPDFGSRMRGTGEFADLLRKRFNVACTRLGLNSRRSDGDLDCTRFKPPRVRHDDGQLSLF